MVEHFVFDQGELVLDDRFFPLVIGTWMGRITHEGVDACYRWHDRLIERAADEGVGLVVVSDLLGVEGTCGLRHRIVEEIDRREDRIHERVDSVLVVARRALVRGSLAWVLGRVRRPLRLSSFGDTDRALRWALRRLDDVGAERPAWLELRRYERPTPRRAA